MHAFHVIPAQPHPSIREFICLGAAENPEWVLGTGEEISEGAVSINVFGTAGNRHSILVIEKDHAKAAFTGRNGRWTLIAEAEVGTCVEFTLEWAIEVKPGGYLVLCGRESAAPFTV